MINRENVRIYKGKSMRGLFRPGDLLTFESIPLHAIRSGDVVVFKRFSQNTPPEEIVHRVVCCKPLYLITKGDASASVDAGTVTEETLVGRVFCRKRNGQTSVVYGGWIGLCRGRGLHCYWGIRRWVVRKIQKPYAMLKASGVIPRLWKPEIFRVRVNSEDGPYIHHVWKNRIVASFWPEEDRFECRKPWDLVIGVPDTKKNTIGN